MLECYGIGIGSSAYVNAYLASIVEEIQGVAEETSSLLEDNLQAKWTFLTYSISQKLSYHQSLQYPTGLHMPRGEVGLGWSV